MFIDYEFFIEKIKKARIVGVVGKFDIEYTMDIGNIINSIELLSEKGKGELLKTEWYTVDTIDEDGILLRCFGDYYYLFADNTNYEFYADGKYLVVAVADEMTLLKIE